MEDYGDNTNELYIHHHGMVVENNPFDCVELALPSATHKKHVRLRAKISTRLGLQRLGRRPLCLVPKRPLSPLCRSNSFILFCLFYF